ncbi:GMC family oxidoreductase [Actinospica robiniae]|uniref:GMC family oxidoreductase n=1 Tax=Actinospica robiniae TaxID=304901 RepID=UPI000428D248|nr:GMC oxidoreductase [Actinospica robiniae]
MTVSTEEFDYVVVGGGTAGCVLAARLSEDPDVTVLLLEDGPADTLPTLRDARLGSVLSLWGDPAVSRVHRSVPQPGLLGREIDIPQGRVLGGGSSINALLHVWGHPLDYADWDPQGKEGWSYPDLLPYFQRAETYRPGAVPVRAGAGPAGDARGLKGPLGVVGLQAPAEVSTAFIRAVAGWPSAGGVVADHNTKPDPGSGFYYQSAREPGGVQRSSAASGYLAPASGRPNLSVRTAARATRLLFEADRAAEVEYAHEPGRAESRILRRTRARREILVCCGALATPGLLARSGVGPAEQLRELGLPVLADLPGVGQGLQDHLLFGVGYGSTRALPDSELLAEAGLFLRSGIGDAGGPPDLQFFFGPVQFVPDAYRADGPGFTLAPVLLHPASRGEVRIASADPFADPIVDPRYLSAEQDLAVLVRGLELARELIARPELDGFRGPELAPGTGVVARAGLEDYVRRYASTVWHPVGTARMGADPDAADEPAVVGFDLAVHGVRGLRVVDASVMPSLPSGNTNAATVAIAERAAALIRGTHGA